MGIKDIIFGEKGKARPHCIGRDALRRPGVCDECKHSDVRVKKIGYGMLFPEEARCDLGRPIKIGDQLSEAEARRRAEELKRSGS